MTKATLANEQTTGESMDRVYLVGLTPELGLLRTYQQQLVLLRQLRSKSEVSLELRLVSPEKRSLVRSQLPRLTWPS